MVSIDWIILAVRAKRVLFSRLLGRKEWPALPGWGALAPLIFLRMFSSATILTDHSIPKGSRTGFGGQQGRGIPWDLDELARISGHIPASSKE